MKKIIGGIVLAIVALGYWYITRKKQQEDEEKVAY